MENSKIKNHRILPQIKELIEREDDFVITSHVHPDGDSITSMLAFASVLDYFGKSTYIVLDDHLPKKFDFLKGIHRIHHINEKKPSTHEVLVILDSSNLERTGSVREIIDKNTRIINIDHHLSNENFGSLNFIRSKESSTVEIVYDLISYLKVPITPDIATFIYTGILCDTGRFLFPNTTARSLAICAEMVKKGASSDYIAGKLYCRMSHETIFALTAALSTLEFHFNSVVSCIHLSNGMISEWGKIDTEGFVDYLLAIDNTEVEFLMIEKKTNVFRVSLRSKNYVDVNEIAKKFGGGGHTRAAGCTLEGSAHQVKDKILGALEKYFE